LIEHANFIIPWDAVRRRRRGGEGREGRGGGPRERAVGDGLPFFSVPSLAPAACNPIPRGK